MGIIRETNPLLWGEVDGIVINESAPASAAQGVAANVAVLIGTSQRGPKALTEITSMEMLHKTFGKDVTKGLNKVMKNKAFGKLKFVRVVADDAVKASRTFTDGAGSPANIIKFEALYEGVYGNSIKVTIEAGTSQGKKYTIEDTSVNAVLPKEVYDNVLIAEVVQNGTFSKSKLVSATVIATTAQPANAAATFLASGSEGTLGDTDYETALDEAAIEGAGNVIFLDQYNSTRNGYLKLHVAANPDRMVIVQGAADDEYTDAITAVASLRDTESRIIYAFNDLVTSVDGAEVVHPAAWWIASIFSQCAPNVDMAFKDNVQAVAGAIRPVLALSPAEYILLNKAGICAFENDPDLGIKIKSSVTTQILDTEKQTIIRRRMTDFLINSLAKYLKNYQNAVNSAKNRGLVKAGILAFDKSLEQAGVIPSDAEMTDGAKAKLIDTDSLNDNESIGQGYFKILYRRRIYSSMRYLVLSAEVGTGVVVTEVG